MEKKISFERTEFGEGKVDFRKVEFAGGKVNFNRASFEEGDITFESSELHDGRMTFKKTDFSSGNLSFEEVEYTSSEVLFEGVYFKNTSLNFGKSSFKVLALISCQLNAYVDFRVNSCQLLDLSDAITRDIVDFSSYDHKVEIDCLNLTGMRLVGQIYIEWHDNNVHRNEQKSALKSALSRSKLSAVWQIPLYLFKLIVIDRMGLYATSPARVILSLITIYIGFSLIHLFCPFFMDTSISCISIDDTMISKVLNTFYYSLITFTTVGYGDCSPYGFLRGVAAVEGFVGPFMMSYFTVAFARKILR